MKRFRIFNCLVIAQVVFSGLFSLVETKKDSGEFLYFEFVVSYSDDGLMNVSINHFDLSS